ncbi:DUF4136 domain-containing protein [Pontiellaceae bacterium B1224]|nr:DUF4136 domain-containing protein [Pontiellaceae bacterium B1224]
MKVTSEEVADFDYPAAATYEWIQAPVTVLEEDDTYLNENVQIALNNALSERGWKQVLETEQADIQVVYYIKLAEQEEVTGPTETDATRVTGGFTYNKSSESWSYADQNPDLIVYTIEIGTLSLLIYDAENGQKIWSGSLQTRLDRTTPLDKQPELLRNIARKITAKIPGK